MTSEQSSLPFCVHLRLRVIVNFIINTAMQMNFCINFCMPGVSLANFAPLAKTLSKFLAHLSTHQFRLPTQMIESAALPIAPHNVSDEMSSEEAQALLLSALNCSLSMSVYDSRIRQLLRDIQPRLNLRWDWFDLHSIPQSVMAQVCDARKATRSSSGCRNGTC